MMEFFPVIAEIIADTSWSNEEHTVLQRLTSNHFFIYSVAVVPGLSTYHTVDPSNYRLN